MQSMTNFRWATTVDLNIGYYAMGLSPRSRKLCVISLPWGLYCYNTLPMGLLVATDVFQEAMGGLFLDLEYVIIYIDDIIVLGCGSLTEHLADVSEVLSRLKNKGMQLNQRKSFWAVPQVEYLGFMITRTGIKPQEKKVQEILNIEPPKTHKQLRGFLGMVNFYKNLWPRRSVILQPLTALTGKSKNTTLLWTEECQAAFEEIKTLMAQDTLLAYPKYGEPFDVHTDASNLQIGGVVSQNGRPIAFFSREFNDVQTRYTTTKQELLAIVETLKNFRSMLLGQQLKVHTDHKKLTYSNTKFSSDRVLRQRLVIEEFGAEIVYFPGERNVVADALSRLDSTAQELSNFEECFLKKRVFEMDVVFPMEYSLLAKDQSSCTQLKGILNDAEKKKKFRQTRFGEHTL